jgi:hypothetical protein
MPELEQDNYAGTWIGLYHRLLPGTALLALGHVPSFSKKEHAVSSEVNISGCHHEIYKVAFLAPHL